MSAGPHLGGIPGLPLPGPPVPDPASGAPEVDPHAPDRHGPLSFDGIRELDSKPPRIWTVIYITTILAALGLVVAYPSIPWLHRGEAGPVGLLGWSSRADLATAAARADDEALPIQARFAAASYDEIEADPALRGYATAAGAAAFGTNCAGCHGRQGHGGPGFPNLADRDWLWGGSAEAIEHTLRVGIRWPGSEETRMSEMPAFGRLGALQRTEIAELTQYVLSLSGAPHNAATAARGAPLYAQNCASCHGERGEGNRDVGAPNLSDGTWLYGGTPEAIVASIHNSRAGQMPAFGGRLDDDAIRKLVVFVRSLGGAE
jgi:cytochrome c oxidase cbb3-type subunit 3